MRLIDADKLERQEFDGEEACFDYVDTEDIDNAPTVDAVPVVHGRWNVVEGRRLDNAVCSNCGKHFQAYYEAYNFCPNCGAKMDGDNAKG